MTRPQDPRWQALNRVRFWFFALVIAATQLALAAGELLARAIEIGGRGHPELLMTKILDISLNVPSIFVCMFFLAVGEAFHAFYFGTGIEIPYEVASIVFAFFKIRDVFIEWADADVPIWLRKIDLAGGLWGMVQIAILIALIVHLAFIGIGRLRREIRARKPTD